MKQAVIFDMDGVLVASGPAHKASWQMLARRHGLNISDQQFSGTFGMASREIIRQLWGDVSPDRVSALDDEKEAIYRELITGMVPLMIGAREVLAALAQAAFVLAVATSGPPANMNLVLDETRLRPFFAAAVNSFDVPRGKPAPDVFLGAAERLGVPPRQCLVIEDAPVGVEAALAAGMRVAALAGTHAPATLAAAGAHRVVSRLAEIQPALVNELLTVAR
ncbi:Beta-phosphoglucomutase [Phycisphaerae bacterium RAS1]|nr:Beta-phosphoglucomutase [Phycisphaerae bacterium RAS1]